jgi:hypothetical protein
MLALFLPRSASGPAGGMPDGIDLAWQPKHYLGAPVPGATIATVSFAHVVAAVEFLTEESAAE